MLFSLLTSLLFVKKILNFKLHFVCGILRAGLLYSILENSNYCNFRKIIFHLETHFNKAFQDHQIYSVTYFSPSPLFPFYTPLKKLNRKETLD